jgi:hypothetical protein
LHPLYEATDGVTCVGPDAALETLAGAVRQWVAASAEQQRVHPDDGVAHVDTAFTPPPRTRHALGPADDSSAEEQEESLIDASLSPCLPEGVFSNPPRPILVRSPTTV